MKSVRLISVSLVVLAGLVSVAAAGAQAQDLFNPELLRAFTYRNVGPWRMEARASCIAVPAAPADHLYTFYLATWTGGVFKTTNGGVTFKPILDGQNKITVGAVAVAPSNSQIVWVGTGDQRGARSSYPGDGVYKSMNAGETWTNMGLRDSHHISRVVIHPQNPDVVFVAAMGHLYSPNPERGVFKTTDGGKSWKKVLFVNDKIGVIDLVMNPRNTDVLYAAAYDMRRTPWSNVNAGPESAIYKTLDGGGTWTKLSGGLPTGRIGKIGLDIYPKNPEVLYAIVVNCNPGPKPGAARGCTGGQRAGLIGGELYRTGDGGKTWTKQNPADVDLTPKGSAYIGSGDEDCNGFTQVRIDPSNDQNVFAVTNELWKSTDAGKTWTGGGATRSPDVFPGIFGDVRTFWIDPQNSNRMIIGDDGGFYLSNDGGKSSDHISNLPVGECYSVSVDMDDPYNVYVSLQDHEDWKAPSNGPRGYLSILDWVAISSGDGMYTRVDPHDSRWAYTSSEWGGVFRTDMQLGIRAGIRPVRPGGSTVPYRSIWGTPLSLSPFSGSTLYTGGEVLLKSTDRGDHWTEISPDLSTNDAAKLTVSTEPGVQPPYYWFCISTISESPVTPGLIWVGTSDGKVHVTKNGGGAWTDLTQAVAAAGGPKDVYVSRVFASHHVAGRAYVAKDGNKLDDFHPYLFMTEDYGTTWKPVSGNLPNEPIHVVWEDNQNPDLLFAGNGEGVFVSIDRGKKWLKMNNNIPNCHVLDLCVHEREHDLVVGSLGRGAFITNISALRELNDAVLAKDVHLFGIKPTVQRVIWAFAANDRLFSQRYIVTPNEPNGMVIRYYLKSARNEAAAIVITDSRGKEVARLKGETGAGVNTVVWNTRAGGGEPGRPAAGARGGYSPDQWVPLGDYVVTLNIGGQTLSQPAHIIKTQGWSVGPAYPSTLR